MRPQVLHQQLDQDATRRLLEERAAALADPLRAQQGPPTTALLVLAVGTARLGLDAGRVREVLPPGPMARPPGGGPLVGARNVRGDILAVADLGALVSVVPKAAAADRWVAVLDHSAAPLGLLADAVLGLSEVPVSLADDLRGDRHDLVSGVTPDGVLLLDVDALLDDARLFTASPPPPEDAE